MTKKRAVSDDRTSNLTRCVCGQVYDQLKSATCPACGHDPNSTPALPPPTATRLAPQPSPKERQEIPPWVWKLAKRAVLLLVALWLLQTIRSCTGEGDKDEAATPVAPSMMPTMSPTGEPYPAELAKGVDREMVGDWELPMGTQVWTLSIRGNGAYAFAAGPGNTHQGDFGAEDGHWWMRSQTTPWQDRGTYQVIGGDTLTLSGMLGTSQWRRTGSARPSPTGDDPRSSFLRDNGILPPTRR